MKKTKLFCGIMGWAVAAVLPVEVAQAQISSYSIGSDGLESFNLSITSGLVTADYNNALAGGIALNYVSGPGMGSFASVCTDISATLWLGGTYTYNAPIGFAGATGLTPAWGAFVGGVANSANESAAIQAAADIFYKYGSILSANSVSGGMTGSVTDERAGLQLAIWTALYNTSVTGGSASILSSFNASSGGRFQVLGLGTESWSGSWGSSSLGTSAAETDAQNMLKSVNFGDQYSGSLLVPNPIIQNGGYGPTYDEPAQEVLGKVTPLPETPTLVAGALLLLPFARGAFRFRKVASQS